MPTSSSVAQNTEPRVIEGEGTSGVQLPNFFMKPQQLAESMRTLRIAANFRNSPRNSPRRSKSTPRRSTAGDPVTSSMSSYCSGPLETNTTATNAKFEQLRQDGQVPVESSEMARIASIFASSQK